MENTAITMLLLILCFELLRTQDWPLVDKSWEIHNSSSARQVGV